MKNKLYYVLFFVYVIVAVIVLLANSVFAGPNMSISNLLINGGFLIIIGILFLISTISFTRLNRCTSELRNVAEAIYKEFKDGGGKSLWSAYQDKKDLFDMDELKMAYNKYRGRMRSMRTKRGFHGNCDIEEYINEELLHKTGMNFFNSAMPGLLTGLGILGTFLGLSIGLGSFNGNDIYAISDNVGTLLGGMKVAFHTSVYGILFSLIFTICYKSIMADAYEKLDVFLAAYRQCVAPVSSNEDENMAALLMYEANMSNTMRQMLELMKAENQAQIDGVNRIVDNFIVQMDNKLGNQMMQLGNVMNHLVQTQNSMTENSMEVLQSSASLVESQTNALEALEKLSKQVNAQGKLLQDTCEEIGNQLYTYEQMRDYYEK